MTEPELLRTTVSTWDNLADTINAALFPGAHHAEGEAWSPLVITLTQAVLADGYRQQRTISTVEELEALPVGSVILYGGRSWQRYVPQTISGYTYKTWQCPDGGFVRNSGGGAFILPATVLHEPAVIQ